MRRQALSSCTNEEDNSSAPSSPSAQSSEIDPKPVIECKSTASKRSSEANSYDSNTLRTISHKETSGEAASRLADPAAHAIFSLNDLPQSYHTMMQRVGIRNPWSASWLTISVMTSAVILMLCLYQSVTMLQLDPKGGSMSFMASSFIRFSEFDTEHTRFATKYALYLYRELGVDEDARVKGVPVLFIPGNAGSYKQVRSLAAEAEYHYHEHIQTNSEAMRHGKLALDFFTVDFNEDFTAFHGQTLVDQAEYLNDAIAFILSLYHNPQRSRRDPSLPDPNSVILVGHSMGGIVARTMLTMPNYQTNSVNTIITLSAPHARPPVSFDSQTVSIYKSVNEYWRRSHAKVWGMDNPLWHVTLISIAGGGLDTIVPSDYASVSSILPETHGFTVFTSTIPTVWTGMDHLAITWCDELRKVIITALFDALDVSRSAQTKPRGDRMRIFRAHFLSGLENISEKSLPHTEPRTLLTLEEGSSSMLTQSERLVIRKLGHQSGVKAYYLPIPPQGMSQGRRFTLLTSAHFDRNGHSRQLDIRFCTVFPIQAGNAASLLDLNLNMLAGQHVPASTHLVCKNGALDFVRLPASSSSSRYPFDKTLPFSFIQYDLETLVEHQFVAILDKSEFPSNDFLIAEFSINSEASVSSPVTVSDLLQSGLQWSSAAERPLLMEMHIPALESSLLAYHLSIKSPACSSDLLFPPLVRQYISEVYESKFFVNVSQADINIHGIAPYMPPSMQPKDEKHGLSFQIWSDPTCNKPLQLSVDLDIPGSFGKLWMRYRTFFATFPVAIVALILAKQFRVYDDTGIFTSFSEATNLCMRREIPALIAGLVLISALVVRPVSQRSNLDQTNWFDHYRSYTSKPTSDYAMNNLLTGTSDPFFWFLVPILGIICTGLCIVVNYMLLLVTFIFTVLLSLWKGSLKPEHDVKRLSKQSFAITSTKQRIATTGILLCLVATVLPYQFAYLVLCIVQIVTTVRAWRMWRENRTESAYNLYNYSHSLMVLLIWVLPINLPVLVVWIRNLAVQWLTPFSSHHNILSIVPFILLMETTATGKMVPRIQSSLHYVTTIFLLLLTFYAAVYGVSYAYTIHQVANILCAWLVLILWFSGDLELEKVIDQVVR